MPRVPITIMGYRCSRCNHEWIPRRGAAEEPRVCPKCKSPYWNRPTRRMMTYDSFRDKIRETLKGAGSPITWTEVRTMAGLPQLFPNNQWVKRLEQDIGLLRKRDQRGVILWQLGEAGLNAETNETSDGDKKTKTGK